MGCRLIPLTPTLSLGEKGQFGPGFEKSVRQKFTSDWRQFSLSPRERVGVRGISPLDLLAVWHTR